MLQGRRRHTEFQCGLEILTVKHAADNAACKGIAAAYTVNDRMNAVLLGMIEFLCIPGVNAGGPAVVGSGMAHPQGGNAVFEVVVCNHLLKDGFDRGRWAIFYDEQQNIYNPEFLEGMEILLSYPNTRFELFINCRNTIQIGTYSAKASGVELGSFLKERGEEVRKVSYSNEEDFGKKIKNIIKELKKEQGLQDTEV